MVEQNAKNRGSVVLVGRVISANGTLSLYVTRERQALGPEDRLYRARAFMDETIPKQRNGHAKRPSIY
ncbi:hypothetical protein GB937_008951 [Aspergillus fischeri]|nr:hypothetical protein GB937_008951 [Aspergillus fischeri]